MSKNVKRSARRSEFIVVRLSPEELARLRDRERRENRSRSDILRDAVPPANENR